MARSQLDSRLPLIGSPRANPAIEGLDLWDMWPLSHRDGTTFCARGRQYWFFLATPLLDDPEDRHDTARIRLTSLGADGWRDHGWALPEGWSPGSREWSGCAVVEDDGRALTMFFTATGRRGEDHNFEQRLFEGRCVLNFDGDVPYLTSWSKPAESVKADGSWYKVANQVEAPPWGIWGFRDPSYFLDPSDQTEHLLFCGSAGWTDEKLDGVIGMATRRDNAWALQAPLISAVGVNSELERPHIIVRDCLYYCFWSSHGGRHDPEIAAPTGLYGMVAEHLLGPWRPLNASGLVAANPLESPRQAYCWWVTAEGNVVSFLDYPSWNAVDPPQGAPERRAMFGGTVAPIFRLTFDGDIVLPLSSKRRA